MSAPLLNILPLICQFLKSEFVNLAVYYGRADLKRDELQANTPAYLNYHLDPMKFLSWGLLYWWRDCAYIQDMDDSEASHGACFSAINPSDFSTASPFPAGLEISCVLATL